MQSPQMAVPVSAEEDGMKLLRFLERRLEQPPPPSQLHKWVRTGQVRVNGGRAKPFQLLRTGDLVRIPPFAAQRRLLDSPEAPPVAVSQPVGDGEPTTQPPSVTANRLQGNSSGPAWNRPPQELRVLAETERMLVLLKPAGLACQSGTGISDSISEQLRQAYAGRPYIPAPAHRLDKDTSGLVLAGKTQAAQRWLHERFAQGGIAKEYLAWIPGVWPHQAPCLLEDILARQTDSGGREYMAPMREGTVMPLVHTAEKPGEPSSNHLKEADGPGAAVLLPGQSGCVIVPVEHRREIPHSDGSLTCSATLLLIRLLTGRKHQIRVQLSSRGHPLIGDRRYSGFAFPLLLLHAYALRVPAGVGEPEFSASAPPPWPESLLPHEEALAEARLSMAGIGCLLPAPFDRAGE